MADEAQHRHELCTPLLGHLHLPTSLHLKASLWSELGGAVGDLGTYIPIVLTLTLASGLDLSATLIFSALSNIATGVLFGIPMPVQPMKAIAAAAIAHRLSASEISAAGICTAAALLILGSTRLMRVLYKFIPLPVVRGVQLSQGLSFAFSAIKYIRYDQDFAKGKSGSTRPFLGFDGLILALSALCFLVLVTGSGDYSPSSSFDDEEHATGDMDELGVSMNREGLHVLSRIPAALIVFFLGLFICFIRDPSIFKNLVLGPSRIRVMSISWSDWKTGFVKAAIPQIPLSILNSVIAVCKLSGDLFPNREASATRVSISVGAMNLIGCWFGAMPVCHGAGGLAGQYRFGGRSGASVVFLGVGKLLIGLVFGNSFVMVLNEFPIGILGVLLLFAGIELAMAARDMNSKEKSFVMLSCAAVSLTGSSAALGFGYGIVLFLMLKMRKMKCRTVAKASANIGSEGQDLSPSIL